MDEKKYKITVSEPWDYESDAGKNIILGHILKKVCNNCVIFQSSFPLKFGDLTGEMLVLFPRFKDGTFQANFDKVSVNGGLLLGNSVDSMEERSLEENSKFVIIGTLEEYQ